MDINKKIENLVKLGDFIRTKDSELANFQLLAKSSNPWFTEENSNSALDGIASEMLDEQTLKNFVSSYDMEQVKPWRIGLILAGNIPLVGFHDILCTYLSGHHAKIKTSSKDSVLTKALVNKLIEISKDADAFEFVERLNDIDAIIATGSNHSAKQFERYFSKYPNIIRRNRNAIAVLSGEESDEEIIELGIDIFQYFGLGCRNVSKIYIPKDYDKQHLMELLHDEFSPLINHNKYKNNYDYNYAIYLLNQDEFLSSGAVILRKHSDIISRIACIHYEEYEDLKALEGKILEHSEEIQCIASNMKFEDLNVIPLGRCQKPGIADFADGVDTMQFLTTLS